MNPCIGDRKLEPDDEPEPCETCGGSGLVRFISDSGRSKNGFCHECSDEMSDPGEPNEDPE